MSLNGEFNCLKPTHNIIFDFISLSLHKKVFLKSSEINFRQSVEVSEESLWLQASWTYVTRRKIFMHLRCIVLANAQRHILTINMRLQQPKRDFFLNSYLKRVRTPSSRVWRSNYWGVKVHYSLAANKLRPLNTWQKLTLLTGFHCI